MIGRVPCSPAGAKAREFILGPSGTIESVP